VTKVASRFALLLIPGALSCGYSQDEWQAQLDKYSQLDSKYKKEKAAHTATQETLDDHMSRVSALEGQLGKMGVNLKSLNAKLEENSTEKARLAANLEELQRAVNEYKSRAEVLERIKKRFEVLRGKLQKLTNLGLKVSIRNNRMVISLPGDVLFGSGSDKLRDGGSEVLEQVAYVIRSDEQLNSRYFQIAGHTDDVPLRSARFKDNWGLSLMRARGVLLYMVGSLEEGGGGLNPQRLHAAGYGKTDPTIENADRDSRQQNRRVELVLMPNVEEMLDLKELL
jgi:chemotaxis protein MotB